MVEDNSIKPFAKRAHQGGHLVDGECKRCDQRIPLEFVGLYWASIGLHQTSKKITANESQFLGNLKICNFHLIQINYEKCKKYFFDWKVCWWFNRYHYLESAWGFRFFSGFNKFEVTRTTQNYQSDDRESSPSQESILISCKIQI